MALILALWLQLYAACIYGWLHGDYYSYGWYVPPLALFFFFRLRKYWWLREPPKVPPAIAIGGMVLLFAILAGLRVLGGVDPRWTLPLWIQAIVVICLTLFAIFSCGGAPAVRRLVPVILFACSAIPLPSSLEKLMVSNLTNSVIATSAQVLGMLGRPVQAIGDQLGRMGEIVQVTEGCSGIRSVQSFLMASLFFGEWMELRTRSRWLMVAAGFATAWILNVIRASSLAWIRFERGEDAFKGYHDFAGLIAFVAGAGILLGVSTLLDSRSSGRTIRRRLVEREAA